MRTQIVLRYIGFVFLFTSVFLFISFLIAIFHSESTDIPFLYSTLISVIFGVFPLFYVQKTDYLSILEGIAIIVFGWISVCVLGSLPYILWGGEFTITNAWFESVSGFTTTGSTILTEIETLPMSLLFWRSVTHWLGGIGVIIFAILILPNSGSAKLILLRTELSGLAKANFKYRAREILKILLVVYLGLTLLETISLSIAGMSVFDAIIHSFGTIATGGFSSKNTSIAYFNSTTIEVIIMVFMLLSGLHFGLLFNTVLGKKVNIFNSNLVRAYVLFLFIGISIVTLKLYYSDMYSIGESLRYASFQVITLGTTTGFASADTSIWPAFTKIILIYFTIQCAMAGSTSGGLKFDRIWIFFKSLSRQIKMMQHPRAVFTVKIDKKAIEENLETHTLGFIVFYIFILFTSTILLTALDIDIMTAFSSSAATLGNVGPGFGEVSSLGNYHDLPNLAKLILSINMLLGRLEIFGILSLFFFKTWR